MVTVGYLKQMIIFTLCEMPQVLVSLTLTTKISVYDFTGQLNIRHQEIHHYIENSCKKDTCTVVIFINNSQNKISKNTNLFKNKKTSSFLIILFL